MEKLHYFCLNPDSVKNLKINELEFLKLTKVQIAPLFYLRQIKKGRTFRYCQCLTVPYDINWF